MTAPHPATEALADSLVSIAAELVGTVRDYGPDDVASVLAKVPDGRHDALAVVLAAMVDPDARPSELLAWTQKPVKSRDFTAARYTRLPVDALGRRKERRQVVAELSAKGLSVAEIADRLAISTRSVHRHRRAIHAALQEAS